VPLDDAKLRLAFVVYGGMNTEDWRKVSIDHVAFDPEELKQNLIPVLRSEAVGMLEDGHEWAQRLVRETQENLARILPFNSDEQEFLEALLQRAQILPEHLTDDPAMIDTIRNQPMLHWKALNVRQFRKV
jgi:hypothetical protein